MNARRLCSLPAWRAVPSSFRAMAGSLAEQLSAAVAAVELGGDNFKELVATEKMYTGHSQGVPDELIKDRLIGEGGYSLVWLVRDEAEPTKKFALKQMHKASLLAWRSGTEVHAAQHSLHPPEHAPPPRRLPRVCRRPLRACRRAGLSRGGGMLLGDPRPGRVC